MLTNLRIRTPDKPYEATQDQLKFFEKLGIFIATIKYNGYRSVLDWTGSKIELFSRRGIKDGGPTVLPASEELKEQLKEFFINNKIPPNTRLDGEWLGKRTKGEKQYIFGVQYYDGKWVGNKSEKSRWDLIKSFNFSNNILLATSTYKNYDVLFKTSLKQMNLPNNEQTTEGIVLKSIKSKLIGDINTSKKNPGWFKVKWKNT